MSGMRRITSPFAGGHHRRSRRPDGPHTRSLVSCALLCSLLAACTDSIGPGGGGIPAEIDEYMASLPAWEAFSPSMADADMTVGETSSPDVFSVGATRYTCTTTPYSVARTPDRVVIFNPDSEVFWLGGLLQGRGYRDGIGSLEELPIRQRAPLTLFIDLLSQKRVPHRGESEPVHGRGGHR
jgi:hypothetical protein